jgi:catechol 2,3-dioxygenase-like lactoylglutathione lyase family enzyme
MLDAVRLTAFLATAHPDRARIFYQQVLGLTLIYEDEFALSFDANGTELRIQKVERVLAPAYTALGWNVPDIRTTVAGLASSGVAFEVYPFLEQNSQGIWTAPSGAQVAWFKDPDGNLLSIAEYAVDA